MQIENKYNLLKYQKELLGIEKFPQGGMRERNFINKCFCKK